MEEEEIEVEEERGRDREYNKISTYIRIYIQD